MAEEDSSPGRWAGSSYVRRARVAPVALVVTPLLPLAGTAVAALPGWLKLASTAWLLVTYAVQELGRDRGLRLQDDLWRSWGGPPTTDGLRWRTSRNPILTADRHRDFKTLVGSDLEFPTREFERNDPLGADHIYEAAVARLRSATRQDEPLLLSENAGYGFRRNCLGLRSWGIATSVACIVASLLLIWLSDSDGVRVLAICTGSVAVLAGLFWILVVNREWVRRQAVSYSECLFMVAARRAANRRAPNGTPAPAAAQSSEESPEC